MAIFLPSILMSSTKLNFRLFISCCVVCLMLAASSCKHNNARDHYKLSFKSIEGITYTEVDRRKGDGLAFNEYGYHLSPEWHLRFVSDDSAALYSPVKKQFLNFPLALGIDSVFNTARAFLKMRHMSKDSLIFEMMEVKDDSLKVNGSRVYMKFYADDFIKNKLHTTAGKLRRFRKADTLFIEKLAATANADIKKAFAAQNPVELISKSPNLIINTRKTIPNYLKNNFNTSDDYMDPTFDITINKAYKDFNYRFSAYVDKQGKMSYRRPLINLSDDKDMEKHYNRMATGILDSYLKLYVTVVPGTTLNIPHATTITIAVHGKK